MKNETPQTHNTVIFKKASILAMRENRSKVRKVWPIYKDTELDYNDDEDTDDDDEDDEGNDDDEEDDEDDGNDKQDSPHNDTVVWSPLPAGAALCPWGRRSFDLNKKVVKNIMNNKWIKMFWPSNAFQPAKHL